MMDIYILCKYIHHTHQQLLLLLLINHSYYTLRRANERQVYYTRRVRTTRKRTRALEKKGQKKLFIKKVIMNITKQRARKSKHFSKSFRAFSGVQGDVIGYVDFFFHSHFLSSVPHAYDPIRTESIWVRPTVVFPFSRVRVLV